MFKNILVPTVGSSLSQNAVQQGTQLAQATGAKIVAGVVLGSETNKVLTHSTIPVLVRC